MKALTVKTESLHTMMIRYVHFPLAHILDFWGPIDQSQLAFWHIQYV